MSFAERSFGPLVAALVLSFVGCGGSAKFDAGAAAGSTSAAAGSTSAGGASSAGAPTASPGGSGGTVSASGGAGGVPMAAGGSSAGAASNDICSLPWMGGECDGAFQRYWHNPATGQCELRSYGGCGGNENRFDTPEQCVAACHGTEDPHTSCTQPTDCELRAPACCGTCEPVDASSFIAVNHSAPAPTCNVNCGQCLAIDPFLRTSRYFVPGCVANHCAVVDIRRTPITECMTSSDCALRGTARCCTGCGTSEEPIAYNKNIDQVAAFCGGLPTPCPACVGGIAVGYVSECREGRCMVEKLLK